MASQDEINKALLTEPLSRPVRYFPRGSRFRRYLLYKPSEEISHWKIPGKLPKRRNIFKMIWYFFVPIKFKKREVA